MAKYAEAQTGIKATDFRILEKRPSGPVDQCNADHCGGSDACNSLKLIVVKGGFRLARGGISSHVFHVFLAELKQRIAKVHFIEGMPRINSLSGNFDENLCNFRLAHISCD